MPKTTWLDLAVIGFVILNLTYISPTLVTVGLIIGLVVYNVTYSFFMKYLNHD